MTLNECQKPAVFDTTNSLLPFLPYLFKGNPKKMTSMSSQVFVSCSTF